MQKIKSTFKLLGQIFVIKQTKFPLKTVILTKNQSSFNKSTLQTTNVMQYKACLQKKKLNVKVAYDSLALSAISNITLVNTHLQTTLSKMHTETW